MYIGPRHVRLGLFRLSVIKIVLNMCKNAIRSFIIILLEKVVVMEVCFVFGACNQNSLITVMFS